MAELVTTKLSDERYDCIPFEAVSAEGDKKTLVMEETVQLSAKEGDKALTGVEWKSSAEAVAANSATAVTNKTIFSFFIVDSC